MNIQEILEQLNKYWNASSDQRFRGEHPECNKLHDMLIKEFRKLQDDEILDIISPMSSEQLEQIWSPLITLLEEDGREWLSEYISQ